MKVAYYLCQLLLELKLKQTSGILQVSTSDVLRELQPQEVVSWVLLVAPNLPSIMTKEWAQCD